MQDAMPEWDVVLWPAPGWEQAEVAVCWAPPHGEVAKIRNLRMIHSSGAGVDNILSDPTLPDVPLCRIVDPTVTMGMVEYVVWAALYFHRQFDVVIGNAGEARWHRLEQARTARRRIGILGLGEVGARVAQTLAGFGFPVSGWSRSPKEIANITVHSGKAGLHHMVRQTDILICMIPLTADTFGILDRELLGLLPKGAALIQCGRGEHLVVPDLVDLVRHGHLRGAVIDVFEREPLEAHDPLWREPGILVTPHMAALAKPATVAALIAENVGRLERDEPLLHQVDRRRGY